HSGESMGTEYQRQPTAVWWPASSIPTRSGRLARPDSRSLSGPGSQRAGGLFAGPVHTQATSLHPAAARLSEPASHPVAGRTCRSVALVAQPGLSYLGPVASIATRRSGPARAAYPAPATGSGLRLAELDPGMGPVCPTIYIPTGAGHPFQ